MARGEMAIFTNMCMVSDGQGNVLVQDRADKHWPGLVYPGGHVNPKESFVESTIREVREETGLTVKNPTLCGVKQFMTEDNCRYTVFLFKASEYEGQLQSSDEGRVFWIPRKDLNLEKCVPNFADLLTIFDDDSITELYYYNDESGKRTSRFI